MAVLRVKDKTPKTLAQKRRGKSGAVPHATALGDLQPCHVISRHQTHVCMHEQSNVQHVMSLTSMTWQQQENMQLIIICNAIRWHDQ